MTGIRITLNRLEELGGNFLVYEGSLCLGNMRILGNDHLLSKYRCHDDLTVDEIIKLLPPKKDMRCHSLERNAQGLCRIEIRGGGIRFYIDAAGIPATDGPVHVEVRRICEMLWGRDCLKDIAPHI